MTRLSRTVLAYAGLVIGVVFFTWPTAPTMVATWLSSSAYHHGLVVAPVSIWLIARDFHEAHDQEVRSWSPALIAVFFLAGLWLLGRAASVQLIEQIAFIGLLISGFAALFGPAVASRNIFALGFLFFMAPFGEALLPVLQDLAAVVVTFWLNLVGVNAALDGVMITTAAGRFEVAEACAGLRFLIASIMIASLISYLAFASWRKRILFVIAAIFIALVANWVRAFLLVYIATATGKSLGVGPEHVVIGWLFYGVLFIALAALGKHFADRARPRRPDRRRDAPSPKSRSAVVLTVALILLAATGAYSRFVVNATPVLDGMRAAPHALPLMNAPGWRLVGPSVTWRADFAHADRVAYAGYAKEQTFVQTTVAYFTHDRQGAEIAGYESAPRPDGEWRRLDILSERFAVDGGVYKLPVTIIEGPQSRRAAVISIYWLDDQIFGSPARLKAKLAEKKLTGRIPRGGLITLAAPITQQRRRDATDDIRDFLFNLEPLDEWLARVDAQKKS